MSRKDLESTIRNLNVQVANYNLETLDTWFSTTMEYIKDYFGHYGQPTISMLGLILAKDGVRNFSNSPEELNGIGLKALDLVKHWINILEAAKITREFEGKDPTEAPSSKKSETSETGFRMPIKIELFYTIVAAVISGAFAIGLYFGSAKFDKEKIDYYNQVNKLSADTSMLKKTMQDLKGEINYYKLKAKADSLNKKNQSKIKSYSK